MAERQISDDLQNVLPEFRAIFEEIFLDEDSDEFDGFDEQDVEDETDVRHIFDEESWQEGGRRPSTFTFVSRAGINENVLPVPEENTLSYLEYFESIVSDTIVSKVVDETNNYATNYLQTHQNLPPFSRLGNWTNTSVPEMKSFLGITIAMGIVRQLDIQDYWSTNVVISTPFFNTVMSRDRFLALMSFLHLSDNNIAVLRGQPGYSPLQKLGDPYKDILSNFQRVYTPGKNIAIDEGMIPWRGNLHFRVYSPDKPCKYGLKMYMLCDSANGYCSRMELYTGRDGQQQPPSQFGATYNLVLRLVSPYLNKGYHLYMDNYFSSPQLFYELYLQATVACGTVRSNRRGIPQKLKSQRLTKGEIFVVHNSTLVAVKYADKKDVILLTTIHEGVKVDTGRLDQDGSHIVKPDCVLSYNRYMGAVDRCDQMVANGSFDRRTLKWWKKVFFHMIGLAVLNSYILYKSRTRHPVHQRIFRRELVSQLMEVSELSGAAPRGRKRTSAEILQRLTARHFMSHLPPTDKRSHGKRRCVVCGPGELELFKSSHPHEPVPKCMGRETTFQCKQCQVALCIEPCFELFHTKSEYVLAYKRQKTATTQSGQEE